MCALFGAGGAAGRGRGTLAVRAVAFFTTLTFFTRLAVFTRFPVFTRFAVFRAGRALARGAFRAGLARRGARAPALRARFLAPVRAGAGRRPRRVDRAGRFFAGLRFAMVAPR